jgi:two-component system, OmpR family, sensor kinase
MEKDAINVSELLEQLIQLFEPIAAGNQIRLLTRFQPAVTITSNRDLVEILLNNLITNAIRYSPAGSDVLLELPINCFIISNPGDSSLETEQLFKRFATASSHQPGTGLGLALIKQICSRYNWKIQYEFKDGRHVFSLFFHSDFIPN